MSSRTTNNEAENEGGRLRHTEETALPRQETAHVPHAKLSGREDGATFSSSVSQMTFVLEPLWIFAPKASAACAVGADSNRNPEWPIE